MLFKACFVGGALAYFVLGLIPEPPAIHYIIGCFYVGWALGGQFTN